MDCFYYTINSLKDNKASIDDCNERIPKNYMIEYNESVFKSIKNIFDFFYLVHDVITVLISDEFGVTTILPNMLSYIYNESLKYCSSGVKVREYIDGEILKMLDHPNVIKIGDISYDDKKSFDFI